VPCEWPWKPGAVRQERRGWPSRSPSTFRTMTSARDANGVLLPTPSASTRFGRSCGRRARRAPSSQRAARRHEPGGPRPLLTAVSRRYSTEQMRRHDVRPGITGWVQVNGRNALSWEQNSVRRVVRRPRVRAPRREDLLRTVASIVRRDGISLEGTRHRRVLGTPAPNDQLQRAATGTGEE